MAGVLSSEHLSTASADDVRHGRIAQRELVPMLLRLKWTLWKRSYRKNIGKIIGTAIGVLYGLGGLASMVFLFLGATLWAGEGETFPLLVRGLGTVTVLVWLLIPVLAFGLDDTLDPRSFAQYPRSARDLQPGMFAAAMLSIPSAFTVLALAIATGFQVLWLLLFGQGAVWIALALVALIPANVAGFALCLLLPRAWFAQSASRSTSRKGRELGGILAMLAGLAVLYTGVIVMQRAGTFDYERILQWMPQATEIAAWTPFGALFAVPMDLAEGRVLTALGRALIGVVTLVLVWAWWRRSITLALTSALSGDASSGDAKVSALVPRFVPAGAFGAVMGRSLRYWRRDTRYLAAIGIYPIIFVFFTAMGLALPDSRGMMLGLLIMMCGMSGISLSNEIGFDGPSGWVNITANVPSRANLLGRVAAMGLLMIPPIVLVTAVVPLLFGMPEFVPLAVLGSVGAAITGWGASLAMGTLMPYPTSAPGTNPMKDKSASSSNAMIALTLVMLATVVPLVPSAGLAVWGLLAGSTLLLTAAGALALVIGVVALLLGLRLGSQRLDARYPELFQKVSAYV